MLDHTHRTSDIVNTTDTVNTHPSISLSSPLILCGLPTVGKTMIGKLFAQTYGYSFVDLDDLITQGYGKTPRSLVCEYGERYFRECEQSILLSLDLETNTIFSLGGGTLEQASNREWVRRKGTVIYLYCDPKQLLTCPRRKLPKQFMQGDALEVCQRRISQYQSVCHIAIDVTNRTAMETVECIYLIASHPKEEYHALHVDQTLQ